eukprot:TRINITY_DN34899_c0_g1_i1.p1 TRINITY_DN34899_c0_g1~~TRINITY_DN34899_c0_g1_i1.p1  ORF type:complete len:233 (+),score=39.99 TRINITY_DN34899_c0_g1_i1:160-858(+)
MSGSNYSLTTFSSSGKLGQIEHAFQAVMSGVTALAIKATDGVVLCTEKKMNSSLIDSSSFQKIVPLDDHCGATYAGMYPDARVLILAAQKHCQWYRMRYGQPVPLRILAHHLADVMQEKTHAGGVRPFGCSILLAGWDHLGAHLYQIDPSGSFVPWRATAVGKHSTNARTFLEKRYSADIGIEDALHTALLTVKDSFDGRITAPAVELATVTREGFRVLAEPEVKDYLDEIN